MKTALWHYSPSAEIYHQSGYNYNDGYANEYEMYGMFIPLVFFRVNIFQHGISVLFGGGSFRRGYRQVSLKGEDLAIPDDGRTGLKSY